MKKIDYSRIISLKSRGDFWNLGNAVLYRLCEENPNHKSPEEIAAKVWLIGRSYAAAIERGRDTKKDKLNDNFYEKTVVPKLQESKLDEYLNELRNHDEITSKNIPLILETHGYLTGLFAEISNKDLKKRSLASKYLHFHCPNLFFLYDSRAVNGSKKLYPRFKTKEVNAKEDKEYSIFFQRLACIRNKISQKTGRPLLSPREMDNILINYKS